MMPDFTREVSLIEESFNLFVRGAWGILEDSHIQKGLIEVNSQEDSSGYIIIKVPHQFDDPCLWCLSRNIPESILEIDSDTLPNDIYYLLSIGIESADGYSVKADVLINKQIIPPENTDPALAMTICCFVAWESAKVNEIEDEDVLEIPYDNLHKPFMACYGTKGGN